MEINPRSLAWTIALILGLVLIYQLQVVLGPFLLAALFAYLGDPLADRLERHKLSRTWSVTLVFFLMTLLTALVVLILLPLIVSQVDLLREKLPGYLGWLKLHILPYLYELVGAEENQDVIAKIQGLLTQNWQEAGDVVLLAVAKVTQSGMAIVAYLSALVLVPVLTFYLMRDWDILIEHIRDLLPRKHLPVVDQLSRECDEVLGAFLRGQLLIMVSLGIIYALGLFVLGLDLALLVGVVAGVASIVPYLGALVGILFAAIAAFMQFQDPVYLIGVAIVFGVGQLLESFILTPMLVGDKIGLHPVAVIFAVMAGGQLFGFVGVLLALPAAAVLMVIVRHAHHNYTNSVFYHH